MDVRVHRQNPPLYARPAEKPPEGHLPLPRGYSIYASGVQTGLRDSGRRAVRGPPRPSRQSPSTVPRRLLVLVLVASFNYTGAATKRIVCHKKAQKAQKEFSKSFCAFCAFLWLKLGYGDFVCQVDVLDRVAHLHAFAPRELEG